MSSSWAKVGSRWDRTLLMWGAEEINGVFLHHQKVLRKEVWKNLFFPFAALWGGQLAERGMTGKHTQQGSVETVCSSA